MKLMGGNLFNIRFLSLVAIFLIISYGAIKLLMDGLEYISPTIMGVCQSFDPITATILGIFIFNDQFTIMQQIGTIIIILSVIGLSIVQKIEVPSI